MPRSVATLSVSVIARTRGFLKAMRNVLRRVQRFGRAIKSLLRPLLSFKTLIAGIAGPAALGMLIRSQLKLIDSLGKVADKLGVSTEALAGFRLAATEAGMEVGAFDKSLQMMMRATSEAAFGTGEAKDAFKQLGLSPLILRLMGTERAFLTITDALAGVKSQMDRVQIASDIFGARGVGIVNLAKKGAAGLRAATEEAKRLGMALSRLQVQRVEDFNDAWGRTKHALLGIVRTLTVALSVPLKALSERLTDMAVNFRLEFEKTIPAMLDGLQRFMAELRLGITITIRDILWAIEDLWTALSKVPKLGLPGPGKRFQGMTQAWGYRAHAAEFALQDLIEGATRPWSQMLKPGRSSIWDKVFGSRLKKLGDALLPSVSRVVPLFAQAFSQFGVGFVTKLRQSAALAAATGPGAVSPGTFQQVDLSRIFLRGARTAQKAQPVHDDRAWAQLVLIEKHMDEIRRGIASGRLPAVVAP